MPRWELHVRGVPIPKGSWVICPHARPSAYTRATKPEALYRIRDLHLKPDDEGKKDGRRVDRLALWRHAVELAVLEAGRPREPVAEQLVIVEVVFYFDRPASTKYPDYPLGPPDADKLQRALGDLLQGIYYANDSQVWWRSTRPAKQYATAEHAEGAHVIIETPEVMQKELAFT